MTAGRIISILSAAAACAASVWAKAAAELTGSPETIALTAIRPEAGRPVRTAA
jgi:hypothetical protein